ncbi:hypothetical protein ACHAWF_011786 [Thalassiosira exigua]
MPSRIDVAAAAAQEEVSVAVARIRSDLAGSIRSPPPPRDDDRRTSPLFRDEVQRQEMRYLDRHPLLSGRRPEEKPTGGKGSASDVLGGRSRGRGVTAGAKDESAGSPGPARFRRPNRPRVASILGSYDRRDENDSSCTANTGGHSNTEQFANYQMALGRKIHEQMCHLIRPPRPASGGRRHRSKTPTNKGAQTAAPSRNRRQRANDKLIQRARRSSRRAVARMAKLGRSCARSFSAVRDAIRDGVANAMANVPSMLEEASSRDEMLRAKSARNVSSRAIVGTAKAGSATEAGTLTLQGRSPKVPPRHSFPLWEFGR